MTHDVPLSLTETSGMATTPLLTLATLGPGLHKPFDVERIGFLPRNSVEDKAKGGWKCKAFPYAEVWDYKRRLNAHAFGSWSISDAQTFVLKDRLVEMVKVSICGVDMWGVGEELLKGSTFIDENATSSAWAQAFKRACAYFGLGLYLYFLGRPEYVPFDKAADRITATPEQLAALARRMYDNARKRGTLPLSGDLQALDLTSLHEYLLEPFPVQAIEFLPHSLDRSKDPVTCTAVPYAKVWHYIRRLNEIAYGQWGMPERPVITWTDKKVMVTLSLSLFGHSMLGIGEEFWTAETRGGGSVAQDNAVEKAWAQAVKRACQAFDLGLYLRLLPEIPGATYEYGAVANTLKLATDLYRAAGLPLVMPGVAKSAAPSAEASPSPAKAAAEKLAAAAQVERLRGMGGAVESEICRHYGVESLSQLTFAQAAQELVQRRTSTATAAPRGE